MAAKVKFFILALVLSLGLDQATKVWARHSLQPKYPETITVIKGFWEFRYSENTGSAFGLLRNVPGSKYLFFVVGIGALWVVANYLKKADPGARRLGAELGLLAGGAVGNIIDRALYGKVTDFIVWKAAGHEWPTFNVADAALVLGIVGLLIDLKPEKEQEKAKAKRKNA
jgi:signal peptidase II